MCDAMSCMFVSPRNPDRERWYLLWMRSCLRPAVSFRPHACQRFLPSNLYRVCLRIVFDRASLLQPMGKFSVCAEYRTTPSTAFADSWVPARAIFLYWYCPTAHAAPEYGLLDYVISFTVGSWVLEPKITPRNDGQPIRGGATLRTWIAVHAQKGEKNTFPPPDNNCTYMRVLEPNHIVIEVFLITIVSHLGVTVPMPCTA